MSMYRSRRRLLWLGFFIVLIVAAFFRLWQLQHIPPGLFGDEAANGLDALDVLAGRGQAFFSGNYGREGLQMWILAGVFHFLGLTPFTLRLPSAIAGVITALAAYWLGYEMFLAPLPAQTPANAFRRAWLITLASGLFTALSFYHILFSRFGARVIFTSPMTGLTLAALWRALRLTGFYPNPDRSKGWQGWAFWGLAGFFLGVALYFYSASRFLPLLILFFLGGWWLLSATGARLHPTLQARRRMIMAAALMFSVAAFLFLPLGHYFLTHPGSFIQRAQAVSPLQHGFGIEALLMVGRSAILNLLQFIWPGHGDIASFHNLPGRAVFSPLTALLALLGLGVSFKNWRNPVYSFLLLWFLIMASPAFLAVDRAPTLPRVIGTTPGVFFFPAIGLATGLDWLIARLTALSPRAKTTLFWGLAALAFILPGALTYRDYFLRWGPAPETADAYEADMTTAWRWLEAHPAPEQLYVSADMYKHLSFILLYEQVPTTEYFTRRDPNLHWFDARRAWPLPPPEADPTILVGDSAMPPDFIQELLDIQLTPLNGGEAYRATTDFYVDKKPIIWFNEQLGLIEQVILPPAPGESQGVILQIWRTTGPIIEEIAPYQIQSALLGSDGGQIIQVSDEMGMRPPEWEPDGVFITWQTVDWPDAVQVTGSALRIVPHDQPPLQPPGAEDGWIQRPLLTWQAFTAP